MKRASAGVSTRFNIFVTKRSKLLRLIIYHIYFSPPPLNHHPFPFFLTLLRRQLAILHPTMPSLGRLSRPATRQRLAALVNSRVAFFRYITQVNLNRVNNTSNSPHRGSAFSTLLTGEGADYVLPPWKLPISVINGSRNRLLVLIIPLASGFFSDVIVLKKDLGLVFSEDTTEETVVVRMLNIIYIVFFL